MLCKGTHLGGTKLKPLLMSVLPLGVQSGLLQIVRPGLSCSLCPVSGERDGFGTVGTPGIYAFFLRF